MKLNMLARVAQQLGARGTEEEIETAFTDSMLLQLTERQATHDHRGYELYRQWREKVRRHKEWPELETYDDKTDFLIVGLGGEAGELLNLLKKDWRDNGERDDSWYSKVYEELTDVIGYAFMLAEHLNIDPVIAALNKLEKVEQRPEWKAWKAKQASKI